MGVASSSPTFCKPVTCEDASTSDVLVCQGGGNPCSMRWRKSCVFRTGHHPTLVIHDAILVEIDLVDHLLQFLLRNLFPEPHKAGAQLGRGDHPVVVLVQDLRTKETKS